VFFFFFLINLNSQVYELVADEDESAEKSNGSLEEGRNRTAGLEPGGFISKRRGLNNSGGLRNPSFESSTDNDMGEGGGAFADNEDVVDNGDFFTKRARMASTSTFSCGGSFLTNPINPTFPKSKSTVLDVDVGEEEGEEEEDEEEATALTEETGGREAMEIQ